MANLPPERLKACPSFTYVGLDIFGPWLFTARRTRGGHAESKQWAIMFICLSSRAVHKEIVESMDSSSCVNALRRFFALRGHAKQLLSDRDTNFIGACKELGMDKGVQTYLSEQGCSWKFNPPDASHMGGSWESMIGIARRILDAILLQHKSNLTHEVLCTLMAEVTAIVNARPLFPLSTDPHQPFLLSPYISREFRLLLETLVTRTSTQANGDKCKLWQFSFGNDGAVNISPLSKTDKVGDLVLLKDKQVIRNCWPMATVTATLP